MIRKLLLSALAVASIATAAPASATDYGVEVPPAGHASRYSNSEAAIAGAVFGLAVGIIASQAHQGGYRQECFDKPVRKWRHGRQVIAGYRTVCR